VGQEHNSVEGRREEGEGIVPGSGIVFRMFYDLMHLYIHEETYYSILAENIWHVIDCWYEMHCKCETRYFISDTVLAKS
jgi:hypothetical protein